MRLIMYIRLRTLKWRLMHGPRSVIKCMYMRSAMLPKQTAGTSGPSAWALIHTALALPWLPPQRRQMSTFACPLQGTLNFMFIHL